MHAAMLGLLAETPIHPGAGRGIGVVDLPVAREAATDYPVLVGSSLKGALLDKMRTTSADDATVRFGTKEHAGDLLVSDARLLLLPVRSLTGSYRWTTCPHLIERSRRDLARAGVRSLSDSRLISAHAVGRVRRRASGCARLGRNSGRCPCAAGTPRGNALEDNEDLFPQPVIDRILAHPSIDGRLNELFDYVVEHGIALYVLIDEYDNVANTILAHRGAEAYESFTHGGGFYRNFFATLKAGTGHGGAVERVFITGVSPITMDDVTSGFNIGTNVSLMPEFNELLGFTAAEVRAILESYRDHGVFDQDVDEALAVMSEWYNGYRFAKRAQQDIYNTDMVLYYLKASVPGRGKPDDLIDTNVRIDYGKLRHLLTVNRQLNGNFDLLRHLIGAGWVDGELRSGFPPEELDQRDNFVSLLHYFGLLSIREVRDGMPRLAIPNQTVRRLMYGYLRDGYRDVGVFATSSTAKK